MCKFWFHSSSIYNLTKMSQIENESLKSLHDLSHMILEKKLEQRTEDTWIDNDEERTGYGFNPKRKGFLDLMMDLDQKSSRFYDKSDIMDDINIFLAAGTETTAVTSSFVLLLLGMHPDIQDKVYEEISSIVSGDEISPQDVKKMVYLEMVIKETLRLFPIVPIVARYLTQNLILYDGTTIPAGVSVISAPIAVHYDKKYWKTPAEFKPERFRLEEKYKRHTYSFIPFSGGLRNCLGKKFAFISLKVLIASIVRDYEVNTHLKMEDIRLKIEVTLKAVDGYPIRLSNRINCK